MTTTSVLRMVMEVAIFMFKYLIVEKLGFMIQIPDLARGQKKLQMTFANIDMLQSIVLSDYIDDEFHKCKFVYSCIYKYRITSSQTPPLFDLNLL